jgi:hypothetical protein
MTLLVTLYTAQGIVFAADSSITIDQGSGPTRLPKQEKFLSTSRVGINGGVVGYFGLARVGTEDMDKWLRRTLDRWHGSRLWRTSVTISEMNSTATCGALTVPAIRRGSTLARLSCEMSARSQCFSS